MATWDFCSWWYVCGVAVSARIALLSTAPQPRPIRTGSVVACLGSWSGLTVTYDRDAALERAGKLGLTSLLLVLTGGSVGSTQEPHFTLEWHADPHGSGAGWPCMTGLVESGVFNEACLAPRGLGWVEDRNCLERWGAEAESGARCPIARTPSMYLVDTAGWTLEDQPKVDLSTWEKISDLYYWRRTQAACHASETFLA